MKAHVLAASLAAVFPPTASAVYLSPDGLGQALVYPYFTAQSAGGNPFNTYISVANHSPDAKAVRVRVREGRAGAEVLSLNLFLAPNDMWTAAVVPTGRGAMALTNDRSCIEQGSDAVTLSFGNALYTGSRSDGAGDGLDRTREGFIELLEMGVLTGTAADAVMPNAAGTPANCAAVRGNASLPVAAPTGGLSGTLTLINVASGEDFTVNAEALADLAAQPYFRLPADPYPAFDAAEISPVSVVNWNGSVYRSLWTRGVDAVSAVFMRTGWQAEYVLDAGTRSLTDVVLTSPTRQFYVKASGVTAPYSGRGGWAARCRVPDSVPTALFGDELVAYLFSREESYATMLGSLSDFATKPPGFSLCAAAATFSVSNGAAHMATGEASMVLGSLDKAADLLPSSTFYNGWADIAQAYPGALTSLANSTRTNASTGVTTSGAHQFSGLPVTGLFVRVFQNGTLSCGGASCQGNYGGAFPLRYRRSIQ